MVHQFAKADREGTNGSRHEHVGTTGRLGTTLQCPIVQGTHLVGMVGEIGVRAGIVERELSSDEQARLMVAGRERATEGSTCLAIGHVGIGKEEAGFCREAIGNLTGLTHEAVLHLH